MHPNVQYLSLLLQIIVLFYYCLYYLKSSLFNFRCNFVCQQFSILLLLYFSLDFYLNTNFPLIWVRVWLHHVTSQLIRN